MRVGDLIYKKDNSRSYRPPLYKEQSNRSEIVRSLIYYVHYYIIINIILSFSLKERKNNIYYHDIFTYVYNTIHTHRGTLNGTSMCV